MDDLLLVDAHLFPLPRSCHQLCRRLHRQPACGAERILVQRGLHGETALRDSSSVADIRSIQMAVFSSWSVPGCNST
jgi:hypothetical protein